MKGIKCLVILPKGHRQGQFDGMAGEVEGLNRDGSISVRFDNGSIWSFDAEHVTLAAQRVPASTPGYTVKYSRNDGMAIGRVFFGLDDHCGTFYVSRDWVVTVGRNRMVVDNVSAAIRWAVNEHQRSKSSIDMMARAFGVPV